MKLNLILITLLTFLDCQIQNKNIDPSREKTAAIQQEPQLRFMFYNTENLFDTYDDSSTLDNDFLPDGDYNWTPYRFTDKINNIYKVIAAVGGWNPPDIIGLCEIENKYVLEQLTQKTPLLKHNYQIVHKDSPDRRGIDVGLLYNPKTVEAIKEEFIRVNDPNNKNFLTRDILYFKCKTQEDTLHFFVNHWPSRWGGQFQSESKRMLVAEILRHKVDSLLAINQTNKIVIAGDFNDTPSDKSITEVLKANLDYKVPELTSLYNLSSNYCENSNGTHKYREEWACLDQIIISGSLLMNNGIHTNPSSAHVFNRLFLMEEDTRYNGSKPFRTFIGRKYNGGFSDHLPVYLDLFSE